MAEVAGRLERELAKAIIGQQRVVREILIAFVAGGHCLLRGVPGLAKTLLIKKLAEAVDLRFNRIQFTPDLMPSDILGAEVIEEDRATGKRVIRFIKGPIFANIILADEINRTPPKTQAALLEAMQEYQVTVNGVRFDLDRPLFVLATQNPIEQEGTYSLPEAQLDRFMFNVVIEYPSAEEERKILTATTGLAEPQIAVVASGEEIERLHSLVREVPAAENIVDYATRLVRATRPGRTGNRRRAGIRSVVGAVGRGPPRRAGAAPRREGARPPRGPERRLVRGYSQRRAAGAAAPHPRQLSGRGRRRRLGSDHRALARRCAPVVHRAAAPADNSLAVPHPTALDPVLLTALGDLELVARVTVDGMLSGLHDSPFHGYSAEFSQYRHYRPGDDLKYVDWKLFARTDRIYTKQYRETTNLVAQLVVDASQSMAFRGRTGVAKIEYRADSRRRARLPDRRPGRCDRARYL